MIAEQIDFIEELQKRRESDSMIRQNALENAPTMSRKASKKLFCRLDFTEKLLLEVLERLEDLEEKLHRSK